MSAQADPASAYRGLWVGQVVLNYANEVTVPLNSNNIPLAPDPAIPTPTRDAATLRLILHVNGAGQVNLLKDVAVINRVINTNSVKSDSDVALVSDECLYGNYVSPELRRFDQPSRADLGWPPM